MATAVSDTGYSFVDLMKVLSPDGHGLMPVAQVLNQINAPLQDGPIMPSNAPLGHRVTMQSALPTVQIGKYGAGVQRSKDATEQRTEVITLFETSHSVDNKSKKAWGAKFEEFHASKAQPFIEAMSQKVALYFAYGDQTGAQDEAGFDGLATRMASLNAPPPGTNGSQVISRGSVVGGDGTSMFIVDWGERGAHWIYPENDANGGLEVKIHEDVPINDFDGNQYFGRVTEYFWNIGLAVEDPRRIARLCNIDASDANLGGMNTQGNLVNGLINTMKYMPDPIGFNRVIYAHANIIAAWEQQLVDKGAPQWLTQIEYLGRQTLAFRGYPLRRLDQISLAEGTVS